MAWYMSKEDRELVGYKEGGSVKSNNKSASIVKKIAGTQHPAITSAYKNWKADPGILSALEILGSPFEAMGQVSGGTVLDKTGAPALATAGYLAGSGMLGTLPVTLPMRGVKSALTAFKNAQLLGGGSGEIPIQDLLKYKDSLQIPEGMKPLFHASDMPWEGKTPRPGTWFSDEVPNPAYAHGSTVRAYMYPNTTPISKPISRGLGKDARLNAIEEPIAQIEDGGGVTSYQVLDPSVLQRLPIKR